MPHNSPGGTLPPDLPEFKSTMTPKTSERVANSTTTLVKRTTVEKALQRDKIGKASFAKHAKRRGKVRRSFFAGFSCYSGNF